MNSEKLSHKLQKSGLLKNEANIYILLFQLGSQPASVLAKKLEIPRSTSGFYLEELYKKGVDYKPVSDRRSCHKHWARSGP